MSNRANSALARLAEWDSSTPAEGVSTRWTARLGGARDGPDLRARGASTYVW